MFKDKYSSNFLKNKLIKMIFKSIVFSTIFLIFYKSFVNPLTYDEAYTFLNFVNSNNLYNLGIANNHPLNTLLMMYTSTYSISEFSLRLPNTIFGLIYTIISYKISTKTNVPIQTFVILNFVPLVFEFNNLARGYGIAGSLIFLGIYIYYFSNKRKQNILISTVLFILASYSIYYSSIFTFSFLVFAVYKEIKYKNYIYTFLSLVTSVVLTYYPIRWMFLISELDESLYGTQFVFVNMLKKSFGFNYLFNPNSELIGRFIFILILFPLVIGPKYTQNEKSILNTVSLSYFLLLTIPLFFGGPYPTGRILVPFLPILILVASLRYSSLYKIIDKKNIKILATSISLIFTLNFVYNFEIYNTNTWKINTLSPAEATTIFYKPDGRCFYKDYSEINPSAEYYRILSNEKNELYCNEDSGKIENRK